MVRKYKFVFHNGGKACCVEEFDSLDVKAVCNSVLGYLSVLDLRYEEFCDLWELSSDGEFDVFLVRLKFAFSGKGDPLGYFPIYD